jgi:hypothetical protein
MLGYSLDNLRVIYENSVIQTIRVIALYHKASALPNP